MWIQTFTAHVGMVTVHPEMAKCRPLVAKLLNFQTAKMVFSDEREKKLTSS